ncbi:effector-associated constant component EACC1 [Streptomyces rubiginosohelvolus]|uniref:effector-associated constant component EACC1 n=1 Tax=Streptomyces rubiginosohelvolus TaxID=67362 RepID=UPI003421F557
MNGTIEIRHTDGAGHLEELRRFLVRDPNSRAMGRFQLKATEPDAGTLGDSLDVLAIVISGTLALPGFIQVVSNWFKSRGDTPDPVEIKLGSVTVAVSGTEDPAEIRRLADVLKAAYPDAGEGAQSR